ncbi:MAG: FIG00481750: hypothetical protein, partial [uncultured Sphingomonadaceae bacterium]
DQRHHRQVRLSRDAGGRVSPLGRPRAARRGHARRARAGGEGRRGSVWRSSRRGVRRAGARCRADRGGARAVRRLREDQLSHAHDGRSSRAFSCPAPLRRQPRLLRRRLSGRRLARNARPRGRADAGRRGDYADGSEAARMRADL